MLSGQLETRYYRPGLDVVRLAAFCAVFLHHALPWGPTSTVYGAAVRACSFGLPLFFTLSAYLITTLLLKERQRTGAISLPRFYKRRALRILPLYFTALAASVVDAAARHTLGGTALWYAAAVLMLGNTVWWIGTSAHHLWSISIEEQFYLFWPTVMRRVPPSHLLRAAVVLLVVANAFLVYFGLRHVDHAGVIWSNTFVQMEFFAAGILMALSNNHRVWQVSGAVTRSALLVFAIGGCYAAVRYLHASGNPGEQAKGALFLCAGYCLVALGCVAIIAALQGLESWPKPVVYLGKISYGLYVFHAPALSLSAHVPHRYGLALQLPIAMAVTIVTAMLSYRYLESPFLRWKERFEVVKSRPVSTEAGDPALAVSRV